ncbi:MAG: hypothetical protein EXR76_15985 [Myxococcales bacterium]|nr:hypothetical protein [Myxococcales bacterium]
MPPRQMGSALQALPGAREYSQFASQTSTCALWLPPPQWSWKRLLPGPCPQATGVGPGGGGAASGGRNAASGGGAAASGGGAAASGETARSGVPRSRSLMSRS